MFSCISSFLAVFFPALILKQKSAVTPRCALGELWEDSMRAACLQALHPSLAFGRAVGGFCFVRFCLAAEMENQMQSIA